MYRMEHSIPVPHATLFYPVRFITGKEHGEDLFIELSTGSDDER